MAESTSSDEDIVKVPRTWEALFRIHDKDLDSCLQTIAKRFTSNPDIYLLPQPHRIFRAFNECSFVDIRVVMMGQDPYPSTDEHGRAFANGIAFSVDGDIETPSLRVMRQWITYCYPQCKDRSYDMTLIPWCKQGVLLINASLTIEYATNNVETISHRKVWEAFIRGCITRISMRKNVVFVLMGSVAGEYDDSILAGNNTLKIEHPASIARKKLKKVECDVFLKVNDYLMSRNRGAIDWCSIFKRV